MRGRGRYWAARRMILLLAVAEAPGVFARSAVQCGLRYREVYKPHGRDETPQASTHNTKQARTHNDYPQDCPRRRHRQRWHPPGEWASGYPGRAAPRSSLTPTVLNRPPRGLPRPHPRPRRDPPRVQVHRCLPVRLPRRLRRLAGPDPGRGRHLPGPRGRRHRPRCWARRDRLQGRRPRWRACCC